MPVAREQLKPSRYFDDNGAKATGPSVMARSSRKSRACPRSSSELYCVRSKNSSMRTKLS